MSDDSHVLVYTGSAEPFARWLTDHGYTGRVTAASTPDEAHSVLSDIEIILGWNVPAEVIRAAPRLRWYQSLGAGVETALLTTSDRPEIVITRILDQFGGPIAEYVFAELLARVRKLDRLRSLQRERSWEPIETGTLAGLRLGVAGLGSIGREIVRIARAFDMSVTGLSRSGKAADMVDDHFTPHQWVTFVQPLDILVLTLPLTPETERSVNASVLAAMKPSALVVNVGRGRLVDEVALVHALQHGDLGGAILDVFEQEPLPPDSPLWDLAGVTVTPHISGPSTVHGVGSFFLENLGRYRAGQPLLGIVDRRLGY